MRRKHRDWRDTWIIVLTLILWMVTVSSAYKNGREDGYWEHEAEENVYDCEVMT